MRVLYFLLIVLVSFCCSKTADLQNFNEDAWKHDKNGCEGMRSKMKDNLVEAKDQLKGLNTDEVISVLGRPNRTELSKRNQKYFFYTISPSKECGNYNTEQTIQLSIRFSAVGLAYEVVIH